MEISDCRRPSRRARRVLWSGLYVSPNTIGHGGVASPLAEQASGRPLLPPIETRFGPACYARCCELNLLVSGSKLQPIASSLLGLT